MQILNTNFLACFEGLYSIGSKTVKAKRIDYIWPVEY